MWKLLFNPFRSNKTSSDGTPSRPPTDSGPTHHKITPGHDKDSFDSDNTHNSNLKRPPSTKNTSSSAPDMESIYNTAQTNKKPKSHKKRSSEHLTITDSSTPWSS